MDTASYGHHRGPPPRLPLADLSPLPCSGLCGSPGTHRQHRKWVGGPAAYPALSTPAARLSWLSGIAWRFAHCVSSLVLSPGPDCRLRLVPQIYGAAFAGRPVVGGASRAPHPPRAGTWLEERCISHEPLQGLHFTQRSRARDFPGGPVVKTSPSNARSVGSNPGRGTKTGIKTPQTSRPKTPKPKTEAIL